MKIFALLAALCLLPSRSEAALSPERTAVLLERVGGNTEPPPFSPRGLIEITNCPPPVSPSGVEGPLFLRCRTTAETFNYDGRTTFSYDEEPPAHAYDGICRGLALRQLRRGLLSDSTQFGLVQRRYDSDFGIFLSRDSVGASSYLSSPNGMGPWSYANLNPSRYTDPDGRCTNGDRRYSGDLQRLGFKHATTELCIAASQRDEMDQLLGLYQYARTDERRAELTARRADLDRKASALEASYEIDIDRRRNVVDPVAGRLALAVVAAPAVVAAGATTTGAALLKAGLVATTFTGSVKLTGVATGTMWDGEKYRRCEGSWYECDRVWAGVQSSSELVLSFYAAGSMLRSEGKPLFSPSSREFLKGPFGRGLATAVPEGETVFRVQGGVAPNASKVRFQVGADGRVAIAGDDMLFVNLGQETRALEFLAKRGDAAELVRFRVTVAVGTALRRCRLRPPPAQIPASGTTALGSHLGSWRRSARQATGAGFSRAAATDLRAWSSASSSAGVAGFAVAGTSPTRG